MAFLANHRTVTWTTEAGPFDLSPKAANDLLDFFEGQDGAAAHRLYNELYSALSRIDGFIPRVSSFRSNLNAPRPALRLVGVTSPIPDAEQVGV